MITGAGRDIGLTFAKFYVREVVSVAIANIDTARAKSSTAAREATAIEVKIELTSQQSTD